MTGGYLIPCNFIEECMSTNYYITNYPQRRNLWSTLLLVGTGLLVLGCVGYTAYMEGYRRGAQDTLSIVERQADKLVGNVEKRLFGCLN
jgi:preprotein translocase subunit Sss1